MDTELASVFAAFDEISFINTQRVLKAFQRHRVSDSHFAPSTGYGYNDTGRGRHRPGRFRQRHTRHRLCAEGGLS
jgi:cystathionine beta-lyase family protein involved in aluminum resistance